MVIDDIIDRTREIFSALLKKNRKLLMVPKKGSSLSIFHYSKL
jgi:hypothetical protein